MKDYLRHSRKRWHDELVRTGWGTDAYGPEFDPRHLPKQQRRDLAAALAAQSWDLEYLEHRYAVKLRPDDFDPDTMSIEDKRSLCNEFWRRGIPTDELEARFGITARQDSNG